jgi:hypothetical protein
MALRWTTARHSHPCATRPPATTRARPLRLHSTTPLQSSTPRTRHAPGLLSLLPQPTMALNRPTSTSTRTTAPPAPRCLPYQTPSTRPSYRMHTPSTLSRPTSPRSPSASTRLPFPIRRPPRPTLRPAQAHMPRRPPLLPIQTTLPLPRLPAPQHHHYHNNTPIALRLCETSRPHLPPATPRSAQTP